MLALQQAHRRAQRFQCANNLKAIGILFKTWALERTNDFPMHISAEKGGTRVPPGAGPAFVHFQVLSNALGSPEVLICPADQRRSAAKDLAHLSNTNLSYFVGLDVRQDSPQMLMAGDRNVANGTPLPPNRILVLETNTQAGWTLELHNCQGNILLVDGSVQQVTSSGLRRLLSASGATNRLAMP